MDLVQAATAVAAAIAGEPRGGGERSQVNIGFSQLFFSLRFPLLFFFSLTLSLSKTKPPKTKKKRRLRGPRLHPSPALPRLPLPPTGYPQRRPHRDRRQGLRRPEARAALQARAREVRACGAGARGRVAGEVFGRPVSERARGEVNQNPLFREQQQER